MKQKEYLFAQKIAFTLIIIAIYEFGRNIPLAGVDTSQYIESVSDPGQAFMQAVTGGLSQISVFSLGLSGFMMAMLFVQIINACRSAKKRAHTSSRKTNLLSAFLALGFVILQAVIQTRGLPGKFDGDLLLFVQIVDAVEMTAGAMIILWLTEKNAKYGIGSMTALILVNMVSSLKNTLMNADPEQLLIPGAMSLAVMLITVIMENTEYRIPVQRISIHNVYAEKNYLAIKLDPAGIMPVMFSAVVLLIPQLAIRGLLQLYPENETLLSCQENLLITKPVGMAVYTAGIYALTFFFAFVMISPSDLAENLLKSGDSIVGLHAGRDTRRRLMLVLFLMCLIGATVMSVCMIAPMICAYEGVIDSSLVMLPSTVMMITSLWCSIYQEAIALRNYDRYKSFI